MPPRIDFVYRRLPAVAATATLTSATATDTVTALFARFRLRLVDAQLASVTLVTVQRFNSLLSLSAIRHLDEAESAQKAIAAAARRLAAEGGISLPGKGPAYV